MTTLEKVRELIAELSPGEKAQTIQWLVSDLSNAFAGIEQAPDVAGGEACIARTRIPVWVVVQAQMLGSNDGEILRAYPSLRAEDLANAWAYYHAHKTEVEQQIIDNEAA